MGSDAAYTIQDAVKVTGFSRTQVDYAIWKGFVRVDQGDVECGWGRSFLLADLVWLRIAAILRAFGIPWDGVPSLIADAQTRVAGNFSGAVLRVTLGDTGQRHVSVGSRTAEHEDDPDEAALILDLAEVQRTVQSRLSARVLPEPARQAGCSRRRISPVADRNEA